MKTIYNNLGGTKMNVKKIFSLLMVAALTTGVFAGCGNKAATVDSKSTAAPINKETEVTVFTYNTRDENSLFGTLYKNFTKETGIKVNLQTIQGDMTDYEKKVDIALM